MSGNITGIMVETRNTSRSQDPPMESLQDTVKELQATMLGIQESMNNFLVSQNLMNQEINRLKNGEGTSNHAGSQNHSGIARNGTGNARNLGNGGTGRNIGRLSKIEFPKFNGEDVKGWMFRCNQFFKIDNIVDDSEKIELVSMHVYDKALVWHQQFCRRFGEDCAWEVYEQEVLKRFNSILEDPLMELKKLKQVGTVKEYQEKFESLLNMVDLDEKHSISLFLGGLKDEISLQIRMFTLTTLTDAFHMAKMQEQTLVALKSRYSPILPTPVSKINAHNFFGGRKC